MKVRAGFRWSASLLLGAVLILAGACAQCRTAPAPIAPASDPEQSYMPPEGLVPDSATAIRIAEAVATPIYGAAVIDGGRPLVAKLDGDVWFVFGTLPQPPPGWRYVGGTLHVDISRIDGRILRIIHDR